MRPIALLALSLTMAGLLYTSSAAGSGQGQTASPSMAQFNALKKQVVELRTDVRELYVFIGACFKRGIPTSQFDGYVHQDANGQTKTTTALDISGTDQAAQAYLLDVGKLCADALAQAQPLTSTSKLPSIHRASTH